MYQFFETLLVEDGVAKNLFYHNKRLNKTIANFFETKKEIDLASFISAPTKDRWRCKVTYSDRIEKIEWFIYQKRVFKSFKIVYSNISYPFKSTDRSELELLLSKKESADEIIIIKNGLVTDTSISNIAIYEKDRWLTPKTPLLEGTMREKLLNEGRLIEANIDLNRLKSAKKIAMINAILGFYEIERAIIYE